MSFTIGTVVWISSGSKGENILALHSSVSGLKSLQLFVCLSQFRLEILKLLFPRLDFMFPVKIRPVQTPGGRKAYLCSTLLARSEYESKLKMSSRAAEKLRAIVLNVSVSHLVMSLYGHMAYDIGLPLDLHSELELAISSVSVLVVMLILMLMLPGVLPWIQFSSTKGKMWLRGVRKLFKRVLSQWYCSILV